MTDFQLFPGFMMKTPKPFSGLWFKYCWLRYIKGQPVIGFIRSFPIFFDENLEDDKRQIP